ncbi:Peptidyl-prolyl cis-trans isomerase NIMA-interacting 1 [Durusdinium trenchii]|uniref:Peptidyl-prolyl cis-trans isomerase NIMA-interacting 1 n=1 Tax=Durusdinium trenchii TaxID=1381693 RepID=A0ABP0JG15_9DINO
MARPCTVESLPRTEALLKEGLQMSRALGVRDLRSPRSVVVMEPKSASHFVSTSATIRFALLCRGGATAALKDDQLVQSAASHCRRPKASALAWNALVDAPSSAADAWWRWWQPQTAEAPAAKRQKTAQGADTVRARHILLRHQQVRQADPMLRRDPGRSLQEAEELALKTLETLTKTPNQFPKLCRCDGKSRRKCFRANHGNSCTLFCNLTAEFYSHRDINRT